MPVAFKLDHLQPLPILFWNFSNFYTFILGSPFKLDHLQPFKLIFFWNFSNFYTFILGSPYYPRGLIMRRGVLPTPNMDETEGFQCLEQANSAGTEDDFETIERKIESGEIVITSEPRKHF